MESVRRRPKAATALANRKSEEACAKDLLGVEAGGPTEGGGGHQAGCHRSAPNEHGGRGGLGGIVRGAGLAAGQEEERAKKRGKQASHSEC